MITSRQKGDDLERAVRAIELAVLRQAPSYHEKAVRIEGKKKFKSSAGVPHEADIWVSVEWAAGYEATFIFECKNWKRKVGKKEAVDFARKVEDAKAQRGFLVAATLTKGAQAIVKSDPRMEWLVARELSADEVPERVRRFYGVFSETIEDRYNIVQKEDGAEEPIDLKSAVFTVHGEPQDLVKYLRDWAGHVVKPTSEGVHPFEAVRRYPPDAGLILNELHVKEISVSGKVRVSYIPGEIVSRFEVATRGRIVQCVVKFPNGASVVMEERQLLLPQKG
jgi:hypothetical protein